MRNTITLSVFILLSFFINSCICELFGTYDLGNNFALLEGDRKEDKVIVHCPSLRTGCCTGGAYVIPIYKDHMKNGRYNEYIETVNSNNKWIIAKTFQKINKKHRFWILDKDFNINSLNCDETDCDSIIQSHVTGPLNFKSFNMKIQELNIDLKLDSLKTNFTN